MRERIPRLFLLLFPIGQVKRQRRGAGGWPSPAGAAGQPRGQSPHCASAAGAARWPRFPALSWGAASRALPGCSCAVVQQRPPAPGLASWLGAGAAGAAPDRLPLSRQKRQLFRHCPKRRFFPQTESNPGLGHGPARAGVDAVFVGRRNAGEGSGTAGEDPVPAALLLGLVRSCCPVRPCRLASPRPLRRLGAQQDSFPSERPCPAGGCSCSSFAASGRSLLFLNN